MRHAQGAAAIDVEGAGIAGTVAEEKVAGQVETRVVVEVDCFPPDIPGGGAGSGVVEGQLVIAQAAVNRRRSASRTP